MEKIVQNPYWAHPNKSQVICQFVYDDGRVEEAAISKDDSNPDWKLVIDSFSEEEIDKLTKAVNDNRKKQNERAMRHNQPRRPESIEELRVAPPNETKEQQRERHRKLARAEEIEKQQMDRQRNEMLFQAKLEAFAIESVKNSTNRKVKSKIRKAKNMTEIAAYSAVLIMEEMNEEQQ